MSWYLASTTSPYYFVTTYPPLDTTYPPLQTKEMNTTEEVVGCSKCFLKEIKILQTQLKMKDVENERDRCKAHSEEVVRLLGLYQAIIQKQSEELEKFQKEEK